LSLLRWSRFLKERFQPCVWSCISADGHISNRSIFPPSSQGVTSVHPGNQKDQKLAA